LQEVNLKLDYCTYEAAKYAVMHWHYSRTLPLPPMVKIGVWENNIFIGCLIYSRGASSSLLKPYNLNQDDGCELTRIALNKHKNKVSKIISISLKLLKNACPKIRLIISFADPNHNHYGGIYQASNFIYTGFTQKSKIYIDKFGKKWHSRQVSEKGYNKQYGEYVKCIKKSECEEIEEIGKYRYILPLDKEIRKEIEKLRKPYPRPSGENGITVPDQGKVRGSIPTDGLKI